MFVLNVSTGKLHIQGKCHYSNPSKKDNNYKFFKTEDDAVEFAKRTMSYCSKCYNKK